MGVPPPDPAAPVRREARHRRRRRLAGALVVPALALLILGLPHPWRTAMFDAVVRSMLYPAPPVRVHPPPPPLEEVQLRPDGGGTVVAWEHRPPGIPPERPAALFFHGNGENLETMRRAGLFHHLDRLRIPYLAVDYPGYGGSDGRPSEASLVAAAEAALDHLGRAHPERPLVAVGWSLGAAVSVQLAARRPDSVAGVALLSPWTTLADVAGHHFPAFIARPLTDGRYDSLAAAAGVAGPALVIHGLGDRIIPADQGERLAGALAGEVRWRGVEGAGHNDLLARDVVWRELEEYLGRIPGPEAPRPGPGP